MPRPWKTVAQPTDRLPSPVLRGYSPRALALAARAWPLRAAEEMRSAMVFRAVRAAARRVREPQLAAWERRFGEALGDELRHTRLCTAVGALLGAPRPRHDLAPVRNRLLGLPTASVRLASLLLVEVAMGETVSMALFRAGRRAAVEPLTRAALASIARDEIGHARLGWAALAAWLGPDARDPPPIDLRAIASRGLASIESDVALPALRRLEAGEPFDLALSELGVLAPETRVTTFYEVIERAVLPRLDRLGIDGAAAFRDRYRA